METTFVEKVFGFEFKFEILDEALKTVSIALNTKLTLSRSLIIPAKINHAGEEFFVTEIAAGAFAQTIITSVVISEGIKIIKENAFLLCKWLTEVKIADSVEIIEKNAFVYCGFKSFTFPAGVTEIRTSTLFACPSLSTVTIPNSVQRVPILAFPKCEKLKKIIIHNTPTNISIDSMLTGNSKQKIKIEYMQ